ncbi:hypothetical protein AAG570_012257 [Ranatra chinensis]|uniref:Uncharacterized protein n=1 Tax=Ranatra chinensis TaxID=642074 RepID=A0ABD0YIN2_9HEMI
MFVQRLELEAKDFTASLAQVEIAGGRDLRFGPGVFARLGSLERVVVRNVTKVFVQKGSFANMTTTNRVRFEFTDAVSLVLEEHSFRNLRGPVSARIARINQVIVQRAAFAWLSDLRISSVAKLELLDGAFLLENPKVNLNVPSTVITLENVFMEKLSGNTFHSPAAEVRIMGAEVKMVRPEAFNAMHLANVILENSTLHKVEAGAFSDRTLIDTLRLNKIKIHDLASNAVLSGLTHLVIDHSKLGAVHPGGLNITVAYASLNNNVFSKVHRRGFSLKEWNSLSMTNNTFKWLESEAFSAPYQSHVNKPISGPEYNFTGNVLYEIGAGAFDFDLNEELVVNIENNFFGFKCHCDMEAPVKTAITGVETITDTLFDSGLCSVDLMLSQCFHLPEGFVNMWNFTDKVCDTDKSILCEEVQRDAAMPPHIPSITSAVDVTFEEDADRERKVLGSIFIIVVCGMLVMMVMSGFMWLRRKGYCTKARLMLLPSTNSLINLLARVFSGNGTTPTGSAHSISRLSVHEYAELQRKIEEGTVDEDVPLEDKATQTLPEELTQELLQSLREKLDDPDNYKEARDMIEHLYDLIKVEESCNRNDHNDSVSINLDDLDKEEAENVYDVIKPNKKRADGTPKSMKNFVSTGTRAPSPDKLLPPSGAYGELRQQQPTVVCEYVEPRDRRVHLYAELPGRSAGAACSMLCDYGEPSDTAVHLYTELPLTNKMANRPLPSKPDQPPIGRPSTSK